MAKPYTSRGPTRNPGTEKASTANSITSRSIQLPARCAASVPSGSATSSVSAIVSAASDSVRPQPLRQQLRDRHLREDRNAQIAGDEFAKPDHELLTQRQVQPECHAQFSD